MKKSDFEMFGKCLLAAAEAQDKELSPERILIYFNDLMDFHIRAIEFALREQRKTSPHFPRVSEIREYAQRWVIDRLPAGSREQKQLESAQTKLDRIEASKIKLRSIIEDLENLDTNFGTHFLSDKDINNRYSELKAQVEKMQVND